MRNRYVRNILCMMAVICAAATTGCGTKTVKDSDVVMEIAGQAVVKAEYQMILASHASEIKQQYDTDTANREDFWTAGQKGQRPLDEIMRLAGEDLTEKKVIAQLAKESGITAGTDYLSIASQMEEENDSRSKAEQSGDVVYGLTAFGIREYYDYIYTQVEHELIEKLKGEHDIPEEELEEIYQENQDAYTSEVSVKMLVAEMFAETGTEQAMQAAEEMKDNVDLQHLSDAYPNINFYELEMSSRNMEEGRSGAYMQRWLTASMMQEGEVCEPFAIGENMLVMRCLERSEHTAQPFEEVKGLLKDDVQTRLAQEDIEKAVESASVNFQEDMLEQIALEALEK